MAYLSRIPAWLWVEPGSMKLSWSFGRFICPNRVTRQRLAPKQLSSRRCPTLWSREPKLVSQGGRDRRAVPSTPSHRRRSEMPQGPRASPCPAVRQGRLDPGSLQQSPRVPVRRAPRHSGSPGMQRGVPRHDSEPSPKNPAPTRTARCYCGALGGRICL